MLRRSLLRRTTVRGKVFEIFCREQLLTNRALRHLTQAERRKSMSQLFKELSEDRLGELKQQASIELLRQAALERAAAFFKPLTPYEFFCREQMDNPAIADANPRDREKKLLQIYESLPEKAREAVEQRAEQYNTAHSKKSTSSALPVVPVERRKKVAATPPRSRSGGRTAKKKKTTKSKSTAAVAATTNSSSPSKDEDGKKKSKKKGSPYAIFVREQMASLRNLAPKERMRAIGERWRSLTTEERQRRLEAGRAKLAAEALPSSPAAAAAEAEPEAQSSPPTPETVVPPSAMPVTASTQSIDTPRTRAPPSTPSTPVTAPPSPTTQPPPAKPTWASRIAAAVSSPSPPTSSSHSRPK
ncbi:hypothetical protein NESM_000320700 [Novymonas esmeraldas]|uniref:HMG box domain-containing protein n=1 Tax=Novymonas esmeraldas TaxID=1808958 RepID=A0AAW0EIX1_9TRYP